jgi:hypothetical protein
VTPLPTVAPPTLTEPENKVSFGENDIFQLAWQSSHPLKPDECYLVTVRYTRQGNPEATQVCVQTPYWYVDKGIYNLADQETGRAYYWSVRLAHKATDASGQETFTPFSPPSEERVFYWL